jgi:hypothetical protein
VIENLLAFLRPSLEENDEWDELSVLVRKTIARGTDAARQREVFRRTNSLEAVVDFIIAETEQGTQCRGRPAEEWSRKTVIIRIVLLLECVRPLISALDY